MASDLLVDIQRDRLIIEAVDALHDAADVADGLWPRVPLEDGVPRFKDVA